MRWVVITLLCANALARKLPNPSPSLIQIEAIRSATTLPPFVFETPPSGTATVPRGGALPSDLLVRTASAIGLCVSLPLYCRSFKEVSASCDGACTGCRRQYFCVRLKPTLPTLTSLSLSLRYRFLVTARSGRTHRGGAARGHVGGVSPAPSPRAFEPQGVAPFRLQCYA